MCALCSTRAQGLRVDQSSGLRHNCEYRTRQTECLEQIVADALAAWQRSIGAHEVVTTKQGGNGDDGFTEVSTRTEDMVGAGNFLTIAQSAMSDIRKIWGVDTASKVEITGGGGRGEGLERVAGMTRRTPLHVVGRFCLNVLQFCGILPRTGRKRSDHKTNWADVARNQTEKRI